MITIRPLHRDEIEKIRDLDRTEVIRTGYRQVGREIVAMDVNWDDAGWLEGDGDHSFGQMIRAAQALLDLGGTAFGAFDGDRLVGIAIYRPHLSQGTGQLGLLHVSNGYRRRGIASRLCEKVLALARGDGASRLAVSATPSESAVGFYLGLGFRPTDTPDPKLLEEEPDDIHMIAELQHGVGKTKAGSSSPRSSHWGIARRLLHDRVMVARRTAEGATAPSAPASAGGGDGEGFAVPEGRDEL